MEFFLLRYFTTLPIFLTKRCFLSGRHYSGRGLLGRLRADRQPRLRRPRHLDLDCAPDVAGRTCLAQGNWCLASGKTNYLQIGILKFLRNHGLEVLALLAPHPENVPTKNLTLYKVDFKVKRTRKKIFFPRFRTTWAKSLWTTTSPQAWRSISQRSSSWLIQAVATFSSTTSRSVFWNFKKLQPD